ncbi:YdhK family protein [Citricoccus alkalitolerans]|uniref:YdhK family protein n=1 Tax=Citricoccus alkalitolerans TaxID=246603 RepID=A0ABV8Y1Q9_9MICC
MNAGGRLALYGAGLAVAFGGAFGLAGALVPDSFVAAWEQQGQMNEHSEGVDEMNSSSHGQHRAGGMAGHDHAPHGGPAPAGIRAAADPTYPVGSTVVLEAGHMPGMQGATATISGAFDTTTYAVSYTPTTGGEPVVNHRWVVHEELQDPNAAPSADGTAVVLEAEHMEGMAGAAASIDYSTGETVYMVDLEVDGMEMTHHKWVVESELRPAD